MEKLLGLKITDCLPNPNNPRLLNEKSQEFADLAESIRAMGVIVPVHVRENPHREDKFELLAGDRRLAASLKAGKETIKAVSHGRLTDDEAFNITFAENFGREDLTPLEQGKAVLILM